MQKLKILLALTTIGMSSASLAADDEQRGPLAQLDTDGDGNISFAEFKARERDPIARMDSDENGVLTLDEFLNARPDRRPPDAPQGIDAEEFEARMEERRQRLTERLTERFTTMDLNGDEMISRDEIDQATFLAMDRDGNGLLSARELRRQRRGGPEFGGPGRGRPGGRPRVESAGQSDEE